MHGEYRQDSKCWLITFTKQYDLTMQRLYYGPTEEYLIGNFMDPFAQNVGKLVWKTLAIVSNVRLQSFYEAMWIFQTA